MKKTILSAVLASAALLAAPVSAATIGSGAYVCESNGTGLSGCDSTIGDLSNKAGSPSSLTFTDFGTLGGYVLDAADVGTGNYPDYATVTLNSGGLLTFSLLNTSANFDAAFQFGSYSTDLAAGDAPISLRVGAGTYFFGIDATSPTDSSKALATNYQMTISAVPLPAGALLLLTGLGGLAIARRKTTA